MIQRQKKVSFQDKMSLNYLPKFYAKRKEARAHRGYIYLIVSFAQRYPQQLFIDSIKS